MVARAGRCWVPPLRRPALLTAGIKWPPRRLTLGVAIGGEILSMSGIAIQDGAIEIEASIVAQGLELEPSSIQALMRKGQITSLSERGVNENGGRYRLSSFIKSAFSPRHRWVWNHHPAVNNQLWRLRQCTRRAPSRVI